MKIESLLRTYYAATVVFLLLDYGLGVNLRVAFLEPWPGLRAGYYGFCLACLAAILWRPSWSAAVGTVESLVTLSALILAMAVRVMVPTDAIFEKNGSIVTTEEIINFVLSGSACYVAWIRGMKQLKVGNLS